MGGLKYLELRCAMLRAGINQQDIGRQIGRSTPYVTRRMHGHASFTLDEIYKICELLRIPREQIPIYFPPGGMAKPEPSLQEVKRA